MVTSDTGLEVLTYTGAASSMVGLILTAISLMGFK